MSCATQCILARRGATTTSTSTRSTYERLFLVSKQIRLFGAGPLQLILAKSTPSDQPNTASMPWTLTFDLRERETMWTDEDKARLVKIIASHELDMPYEAVEMKLYELSTLIPDLEYRVATMTPHLLKQLISDTRAVARKLIILRELLPRANVSLMVARQPDIILKDSNYLSDEITKVKQLLGEENIDEAVAHEPRMLDSELVAEVLQELRRLMPNKDPTRVLMADPSWILRVEKGVKRLGQHPDM